MFSKAKDTKGRQGAATPSCLKTAYVGLLGYGRPFTSDAATGRHALRTAPPMIALPVILLIVLLILSGLFSSVETAFTSLTPGQINAMAENEGKRGRLVQQLAGRSDLLLVTLLIGNNLANLGASALATAVTIEFFGNAYIAAATGILTLAVLIFCEVTPKQIALVTNEKICLRSARIVRFLSWIFRPVIWGVGAVSRGITFLFIGRTRKELTLENLLHHVKAAEGEGIVESYEEEMVRNVFRINDTPVEAIMTHRTELFSLDEDMTVSQAMEAFLETGHSRAPILKSNQEHVSGVVALSDLARAMSGNPQSPVRKLASPPYLVPGTMKAHELFFRLKREPIHLAVVLDEYGGLDGVVTREDVMEEIFGELYDERESDAADPISAEEDGSWLIQGDADFYDVTDVLGLELEHDNRTHTVGGYLLEKLERIPVSGTEIELPEGRYEILETRKQRITEVRFHPNPKEED